MALKVVTLNLINYLRRRMVNLKNVFHLFLLKICYFALANCWNLFKERLIFSLFFSTIHDQMGGMSALILSWHKVFVQSWKEWWKKKW